MSTTFSVTVEDLVTEALEDLTIVGEYGSLNGSQLTRGIRAVNLQLQEWAPHGIDGFVQKTQTISLTSGTGTYTLGESGADVTMARPLVVRGIILRDADGDDFNLVQLSKDGYQSLTDKDTSGPPSHFWYDKGSLTLGTLYTYPVINADGYSLLMDYRRPLTDVDEGSDVIDIGQAWYTALIAGIRDRMAKKYGKKPDVQDTQMKVAMALGVTRELNRNPLVGYPGEYD